MAVTEAKFRADGNEQRVVPVSASCPWDHMLKAGQVATADNSGSTVIDPGAITNANHVRMTRQNRYGTLVLLRLGYDVTLTSITAPVLQLFGRFDSTDPWQELRNSDGESEVTFTPAPTTDPKDTATYGGSQTGVALSYTKIDRNKHIFDCQGCNEFMVAVKTALAGSTGVVTTAVVDGKII